MLRWHVDARYDVWSNCWRMTRSDPPGLDLEAPTEALLRAQIEALCCDAAGGEPYDLTVTSKKQLWTLSSPLFAAMLVDGLRVSRRVAERLRSRFEAA